MKRIGFACIVAAVALGCRGDGGLPPAPTALIQDGGTNNGGNDFFFWLPPIRKQQPPADQVFSKQLSPTGTIRETCPDGTTRVVRTFSGSEIQVSAAEYHVNWRTSDDNLDAACTYRILVSTGSEVLGLADVDVAADGKELKDVNTGESIPLLDGRTLPIRFFIGIGSQCEGAQSDCGEGTARPGENTTIVTKNGQAGVFIPAGAVDQDVTITIESSDDRPCFPGLLEPIFSGNPGAVGNSCYDFRADPPLSEINELGKFNKKVIVGFCVDVGELPHAVADLIQIFQFDEGREPAIRALPNVSAPFLQCDPNFSPNFGSRRSGFGDLAARGFRSLVSPLARLLAPRLLFAGTRVVALDLGTGGSTEDFSRFTWALPSAVDINFDLGPDLSAVAPGTIVNTFYSRVGVRFSRTNPLGLCAGENVYANDHGPDGFNSGQNNITVCPEGVASDFSELEFGAIEATFTVPGVQACVDATPLGLRGLPGSSVAFIEAFDSDGEPLGRTESTTERVRQQLCVRGIGIASVRFAGAGAGFAIFDNLSYTRALPPPVIE